MSVYWVYILRNPRGRHYIGLSDNLERHLAQHNAGVSRWAGANGPWVLVWQSKALALGEARKLENLLKRQKGGVGLYRITRMPKPSSSGS